MFMDIKYIRWNVVRDTMPPLTLGLGEGPYTIFLLGKSRNTSMEWYGLLAHLFPAPD